MGTWRYVTILVGASLIDRIQIILVKENQEDDVVAKTSDSMKRRDLDDKGEQIVYERVQRLIRKRSPWKSSDGFELVVDEQLWRHQDEAKDVDETHECLKEERVPASERLRQQGMARVGNQQGRADQHETPDGHFVVRLGRRSGISRTIAHVKPGKRGTRLYNNKS